MNALQQTKIALAVLSIACAVGASAQQSPAPATNAPGAATTGSTGMDKGAGTGSAARSGSTDAKGSSALSSGDRKFVDDAARGGMAEVELGKLADQKASSDEVKQFGRHMVEDHTKANDELKKIASDKGVTLPADVGAKHKRAHDKLARLSGAEFDRAYMQQMVADHKETVAKFRTESRNGKDGDLKSFATSTLPKLEEHLRMAQSTDQSVRKSGTRDRTSSSGTGTGTPASVTGGTGKAAGTGSATASTGSAAPSGAAGAAPSK